MMRMSAAAEPEPHWLVEYKLLLRKVLRLSRVENTDHHQVRQVARIVFRPSFDPECAVTLALGPSRTTLTIRTLPRSIWSFYNARNGGRTANPVVDWVEPALSIETHDVPPNEANDLWTTAERGRVASKQSPSMGIDGMTVEVEHFTPDQTLCVERWGLRSGENDANVDFAIAVWDLATRCATTDAVRRGLGGLARYVGDVGGLYCPKCGDGLTKRDGIWHCESGGLEFSASLGARLEARFKSCFKSGRKPEQPMRLGLWYCPACGIPLNETTECRACGLSLHGMTRELIELHPHLDPSGGYR
jgi:ribosomal protein L37AE/L43A